MRLLNLTCKIVKIKHSVSVRIGVYNNNGKITNSRNIIINLLHLIAEQQMETCVSFCGQEDG